MAASSKLTIANAEARFPVRVRVAQPAGGFGVRRTEMYAWLDQNCGADGWAMTPSGLRGVLNDAVAIYFPDTALATAFVRGGAPGRPDLGQLADRGEVFIVVRSYPSRKVCFSTRSRARWTVTRGSSANPAGKFVRIRKRQDRTV